MRPSRPFHPHVRPLLGAALLLALTSTSTHVRADSRLLHGGEGCEQGEGREYLMARYQWYVEAYGDDGVFNPERRLAQMRDAYAQYRRESAQLSRAPQAAVNAPSFRFLGPTNGAGRMPAVELHPTDPDVVYVGAAGGGCWKSTDRGASWRALTDGLGDLSVGAVALAPSNPSVVYLGTGEGGYASDFIPGIGILRSTDGGETWSLPPSVVAPLVYRLSVDPRSPGTVVAGTNEGAQRTTDGGLSWTRTSDPSWGDAADLARDPVNPDVLHGAFWSHGTPERGLYARSTNGGLTWQTAGTGLPADPKSRMSLAISSSGTTVYTLISASDGSTLGLYRSTNGGAAFTKARLVDARGTAVNPLGAQGWYDNCLAVDPDDSRVLLIGGQTPGTHRSVDGGDTLAAVGATDDVHVDVHQLVFKNYGSTKVAWNANDGGVWLSTDGGVRWTDRNAGLATRQYYGVALDPTRRDVYYAGSQDNGSDRRGGDGTEFTRAAGGDGFETAVDPDRPSLVYVSGQFATVHRSTRDGAEGTFAYVSSPVGGPAYSSAGGDVPKPFHTRVVLDPRDPRTVYTVTWRVWRSQDSGESWAPLESSQFLTTARIRTLALSRSRPGRMIAVQSNLVIRSDDGGASWQNLNGPTASQLLSVEIDPSDADVVFVSAGGSAPARGGNVFKSTNGGVSFTRSDTGLPNIATWVVRVDPGDARTVYAGTLLGLYRSTDGGATWSRFGAGLPAAAIHDIRIAPDGSRLAVATHGRGLWAAEDPAANRLPVPAITAPSAAVTIAPGDSVAFSGTATDPDGDAITGYRWSFGEGQTAAGASPSPVTFRTPGIYVVTLLAEDARGGRGAATLNVTVTPANDACADAEPVALPAAQPVVVRGGNGGARLSDPADPTTCSQPDIVGSVWYALTPPADGTLDVDTFGSIGDTVMALYAGTCEAPGPALACNDDFASYSGGPSKLPRQNVQAGKTYRVLVASWADPSHGYDEPAESLKLNALFQPTANDALSPGTTAVLPVVLDAFGKDSARFTSDLTLLNRGSAPIAVALTYGGNVGETGATTSSFSLAPGAQVQAPDALAELRRQGIGVPLTTSSASQVGSLTAYVTQGDPAALVLASRTASPNPNASVGGSFGLFTAGIPFADAAEGGDVLVYGLRQTDRDRANLALVHVRTPHSLAVPSGPVSLEVSVFDAAGNAAAPLAVALEPGEWKQLNEVLAQAGRGVGDANGGYARIRRLSGDGRFAAYGVVNDQKTADGSYFAMVRAGGMTASDTLVVPIVLEAGGLGGSFFTSELVLANRSTKGGTVQLRYQASPILGGAGSGTIALPLAAGAQRVIPGLLEFLRGQGLAIPRGGAQGGALFVTFQGFDASDDVYAGVRTTTPNPDAAQGGSFGVFSPAVPARALNAGSVTIPALRQDAAVRSNLAVVNAGTSPITLTVQLRGRRDGAAIGVPLARTLAPGEWYQWSNVFAMAGAGASEAWATVTRTAGDAPWYAYGVLNDGKTSDGSFLAPVN